MEREEQRGQWAVVELMGHKTVAGLVSKTEMLGKALLRIDVPATERFPAFTQLYGEAAIYCVTFASEEVACRVADAVQVNPVSVYAPDLITPEQHALEVRQLRETIQRLRALPAPGDEESFWQDQEEVPL